MNALIRIYSHNGGVVSRHFGVHHCSFFNLTLCVPCIILQCVDEQRDARWTFLIINILFHSFLSALHVSNECSRSSSGARQNILYYTVWYNRYNRAGESTCSEAARLTCTIVPNCVIQYIMPCS